MKFFGQHENEKVVLLLRRHWTVLINTGTKAFFMLFALALALALATIFLPTASQQPFVGIILFCCSTYLLFVWSWVFLRIVDYYLDAWIITDKRIVDIEQAGLFKRVSSTLNLTKIQDITTEVSGMSATMMHYGSLYIQTAGEKERFSMEHVGHPEKVKAIIMDLYNNALRQEREEMLSGYSEKREEEVGPFPAEDRPWSARKQEG